jgi:hypothetical protein
MKTVILIGLIITATAAVVSPGLSSAAAVVAMVGWAYEHATRMGERDKLRQVGIELENSLTREQTLVDGILGNRPASKITSNLH